jgi:hypothetical protein
VPIRLRLCEKNTDFEGLALDEVDGLVVLEEAGSDFGTLGIEHDSTLMILSLLESLTESVNDLAVALERG